MQLKTNKKEEAKMSKSIKVKKICNGNKESKDQTEDKRYFENPKIDVCLLFYLFSFIF